MVFRIANNSKLQNDIFCLTEERDYFQQKFLEQVSEIANLKEQLRLAKKEVGKLRSELVESSMHDSMSKQQTSASFLCSTPSCTSPISKSRRQLLAEEPPQQQEQEQQEHRREHDDNSTLTSRNSGLDSDEESEDEDESLCRHRQEEEPEEAEGERTPTKNAEDDDDDNDSAKDIRQSAEKLLQWASYRSSVNTSRTVASTPTTVSIDDSKRAAQVDIAMSPFPLSISHPKSSNEEQDEGSSSSRRLRPELLVSARLDD